MTEAKFKIGDPVRLKISSTAMLVKKSEFSGGEYLYMCVWIDKEGRPHSEVYNELLLLQYVPPLKTRRAKVV